MEGMSTMVEGSHMSAGASPSGMKALLNFTRFRAVPAIQSGDLHTPLGHAFHALQPTREKLHDGHHLVTIAWHAVSRFTVALNLNELEQTLELFFCSGSDD